MILDAEVLLLKLCALVQLLAHLGQDGSARGDLLNRVDEVTMCQVADAVRQARNRGLLRDVEGVVRAEPELQPGQHVRPILELVVNGAGYGALIETLANPVVVGAREAGVPEGLLRADLVVAGRVLIDEVQLGPAPFELGPPVGRGQPILGILDVAMVLAEPENLLLRDEVAHAHDVL